MVMMWVEGGDTVTARSMLTKNISVHPKYLMAYKSYYQAYTKSYAGSLSTPDEEEGRLLTRSHRAHTQH